MKRLLAADGFDPVKIVDPLYVYDAESAHYVTLDRDRYAVIANGDARL